ncbi:MAG: DNA primase [bacterium]|nr:DNA primase [bacterium]
MAGMIPDTVIEDIQQQSDIVSVISSYIPLKQVGRSFKALCPFHHEKTPSFIVSPEKQIFHCFGCGAGGNVFGFVMKYENMTFIEAVESLADKAGISITRQKMNTDVLDLYRVHNIVSDYFNNMLINSLEGKHAYKYLKNRGIDSQIIKDFKLGYAPASPKSLLEFAKGEKIPEVFLVKAGIIAYDSREKNKYVRFKNRIIFPIYNTQGKIVGFAGRALDDKTLPKYLNSPQTDLYNKSNILYGLNIAKKEIADNKHAVIVEGYMDLLSLYQAGFLNVVASSGTSLTVQQAKLLLRYATKATIVYDGDTAGTNATLRGLDILVEQGLMVKIVRLPVGEDPDSFLNKYGKNKFSNMLEAAVDIITYRISILENQLDSASIDGKAEIAKNILPTISKITDSIRKSEYIRYLAARLSLDEASVLDELGKIEDQVSERIFYHPSATLLPTERVEKHLLQLMLEDTDIVKKVRRALVVEDFLNNNYRQIVDLLFKLDIAGKMFSCKNILNQLESDVLKDIVTGLIMETIPHSEKEKEVDQTIAKLKEKKINKRIAELNASLGKTKETGEVRSLLKQIMEQKELIIHLKGEW